MAARPIPEREDQHQVALFQWARAAMRVHPELALLLHVPNGGFRRRAEAKILAGMGVKHGVPDILLPVARHGFGALWIELKRPGPHKVSDHQAWWIERLNAHGQKAVIAIGWEQAREQLLEYLGSIA